jgi:hypothetical protein
MIFNKYTNQPAIGSVLYCDLTFGLSEHSGIYVGGNEIIHLNGKGIIEYVSPTEFISGTSAINIFVSCIEDQAVGDVTTAKRARDFEKKMILRDYNFILNNCHIFSSMCVTGNTDNSDSFLWMLKDTCNKEFHSNNWRIWDRCKKFGAIAYSEKSERYWYSYGFKSEDSARNRVINDSNGYKAKVLTSTDCQWIAFIIGKKGCYSWGSDNDKIKAINRARSEIQKLNDEEKTYICFSCVDGHIYK